MKILRVITRLNIGGPAIQAIDLNRELLELGHSCRLVTGVQELHEGDMSWPKGSNISIYDALVREINPQMDYLALKLLRKEIWDFRPDIIHTHMAKAGFLARLAALTARPRPKLVHTFHGHVFHSYFGKFKSRMFRFMERQMAKRTDAIIAISETQKKELVETYRIASGQKVRVIPLGFDLDKLLGLDPVLSNKLWSGKKNRLSIGILGRLTDIKNHKLFYDFCLEMGKHAAIEIHIYGDGEEKENLTGLFGERFERDSNFYDWHDPVYFHDWHPHENIEEVYKKLDIVVCSSKNEGTPVALIEAMAAGRLVVSTMVGGVPDLLGKRFYGLWCTRGVELTTPRITALAINELIGSKPIDYLHKMVYNAREYVNEQHNLDRLVSDITGLYGELLYG